MQIYVNMVSETECPIVAVDESDYFAFKMSPDSGSKW